MANPTEGDPDFVHRVRNHIQNLASLLHLHAGHVDETNARDLHRKMRARLATMAQISLLTVERPHEPAAAAPLIEAVANAIGRIYDGLENDGCVLDIDDFALSALDLAVVGQIFGEYLSNIYSRAASRHGRTAVVVRITRAADGAVSMSVRDERYAAGQNAEPVDPLTARITSGLVAALGGEAQFDGDAIFDARLTFKERDLPG